MHEQRIATQPKSVNKVTHPSNTHQLPVTESHGQPSLPPQNMTT